MTKKITNLGSIHQNTYSDDAKVLRVAETGHNLAPKGAIATAVKVGDGQPVMVFNSDTNPHYVKFGDESVAAPSGPANGIPIPAGQFLVLNSGANMWIRSDSATVYAYSGDNE